MHKHIKFIVLLLSLQVLAGCATSSGTKIFADQINKDYSNMYLRGIFNWWEARESFKLTLTSENTYTATIELIADGQPYDFKVADNAWSMELNCGNEFGATELTLNKARKLICAADSVNLQFTPSETSQYQFIFDVSDSQQPLITIVKVS